MRRLAGVDPYGNIIGATILVGSLGKRDERRFRRAELSLGRYLSAMCLSTPQEAQQDSDAGGHTDRDQGALRNHALHSVGKRLQRPIGSCCNLPRRVFRDRGHGNILSN
jgi:hypothetical protein